VLVALSGVAVAFAVGGGHPGTTAMVDLAQESWRSRFMASSVGCICRCILAQASAAGPHRSAAATWRPLSNPDVEAAVTRLRTAGASLVAVSGHDSTPYTMRRFAAAFGPRFREAQVGDEIQVDGRS
jgi:hypothetical protein